MSKAKYMIKQHMENSFALYEHNQILVSFTRETFREAMEEYAEFSGRSSKWIGSILKLFHQQYPPPQSLTHRSDRLNDWQKTDQFIENLTSRGFRVYRPLDIEDAEMIAFLENKGFVIERPLNSKDAKAIISLN